MAYNTLEKKKFSIHYMLKSPVAKSWEPNSENPVECANLESLLARLAKGLPPMFGGVRVVGVKVVEVTDAEDE